MNKYTKEWVSELIQNFKSKKFNKISDSKDYFIAYLLENNPDADILTITRYVEIILTEYYFKHWKENEFDKQMFLIFNELYEKINPLKNNWPKIKDKYEDLTETINETLNTDGTDENCKIPDDIGFNEITIKKYVISVLNQSSNYSKNSAKIETMNKSLIDDFDKILKQPTELNLIKKAVLNLQPYVYNSEDDCNCGYCNKCIKQEFDPNGRYYRDLIKHIKDLNKRIDKLEWRQKGDKGDRGAEGNPGEKGDKGDKGDKGEPGSTGGSLWDQDDSLAVLKKSTNISLNQKKLTNLAPAEFDDDAINFKQVKNYADTINLKLKNKAEKDFVDSLANTVATKANKSDLDLKQNKLKIIPSDGRNNADLDENGNLRIWTPKFNGNKNVNDYSIIDSTVAGIESTDDTFGTTKYIDKFYLQKKDLPKNNDWTFINEFIVNIKEWTMALDYDTKLDYKFIITYRNTNANKNYIVIAEIPGYATNITAGGYTGMRYYISNESLNDSINFLISKDEIKLESTSTMYRILILTRTCAYKVGGNNLDLKPPKQEPIENLDLTETEKKDKENLDKLTLELKSEFGDLYPEEQIKSMLELLNKERNRKLIPDKTHSISKRELKKLKKNKGEN